MKPMVGSILGVAGGLAWLALAAASARAEVAAENPYTGIVARNVFELVPMPTNDPTANVKKVEPPIKITPDGIMSLFGSVQVLFKATIPAQAGQPAHDETYTMSEGDREDEIAVVKIDQVKRMITFDNHGVVQELPLVPAGAGTGSGAGTGGGGAATGQFPARGLFGGRPQYYPGMPVPTMGGGGGGGGIASGMSGSNPGANNGNNPGAGQLPSAPGPSPTSYEGAQARLNNMLNDPNYLTPESQTVLMEANRAQLQAQGDPTAALLPPTDLTPGQNGGPPGP